MSEVSLKDHSYKIWYSFLKHHWPIYLIGIGTVVLTDMMQVLVTRCLGWILDFFNSGIIPKFLLNKDKSEVFLTLFFILLGSRIILFFSRFGWRVTLGRLTHRAASKLKEDIWHHVRFFKRTDLNTRFTKGMLMNATTSDVNTGRFVFGFTLIALIDVIFLGFFTLLTMLSIHRELTIWSLIVVLILPYFIRKLSSLEIDRYRKAQEFLGDFNDLASQVVSTIRLQRLTQTGGFWRERLMGSADEYRKRRLDAVNTSLGYIPVMGSSSIISYLVLFAVGIRFYFDGSLSLGGFVAMQGLIFLLQDPLFELGFIISEWRKSFTSLERLAEIYTQEKDESLLIGGLNIMKEEDIENFPIVLEAKNIGFSYDDSNNEKILSDFGLKIKQGDRVGISGEIGSGKSTLVNILSGIERGITGELYFHGKTFDEYSHEGLRLYIGHVSQRPFLFADTIRENIRLDQSLDDDEIWYFLALANLDKDIQDFPDQLDTPLGEWGINLSGGQKQRLTLARALARRPKLLFLDDCLSAVDTVTEEKILKNLDRELTNTTLVWVAHRKSTLKYCNQMMELS